LGYAPFAKQLARSISKMPADDGLVIGIYGPWGAGKSTLLNFVRAQIEAEDDEDGRPVLINFNPWWFAGGDALVRHFFAKLHSELKQNKVLAKKALAGLAKLAGLAGQVAGSSWGQPRWRSFSPTATSSRKRHARLLLCGSKIDESLS
jgi:predicted KAP-like P-loop ATPase